MVGEREVIAITDRDEWLERKRKFLGASEIACLFGLHDFKTLAQLVAEKRGLDGLGPDPDSDLIRRGNALEDDVITEVQKLRPDWVITPCRNHYIEHGSRIAVSPDTKVVDPKRDGDGVMQIKVVSRPVFQRKWADGPPIGYLLQAAAEAMIVDTQWAAIAALEIGDFTFKAHVYEFERNHAAEIRLRTAATEFWRMMDAGEHPAVDFERDGKLIALMYPREIPDKVVDLSTDNAIGELLERREILKATEKDLKTRLTACENEIKAKIGDAERALVNGWNVTFRMQHSSGYTVDAKSFRVLRTTRELNRSATS